MNSKKDMRGFERTRAANIVLAYENELIDKLYANPKARNALQVEALILRLEKIREEIMGSMKNYVPPIKRDPGGDFSLEEIEAAMEMLEENNPFEG